MFERGKAVHALQNAATGIGLEFSTAQKSAAGNKLAIPRFKAITHTGIAEIKWQSERAVP